MSVLLAHIVATRSHDDVVTDEAMDYPDAYKTAKSNKSDNDGDDDDRPSVGHQDTGRTVCIHSLAVHPKLQGVGMGKLIVKAYLQQIKSSEIADRVALICQEVKSNTVSHLRLARISKLGPGTNNERKTTVPSQLLQAARLHARRAEQGEFQRRRLARYGRKNHRITSPYYLQSYRLSVEKTLIISPCLCPL